MVQDKIYLNAKLCVPEDRVVAVLMAFHVESGHPGMNRVKMAPNAKFEFPDTISVPNIVKEIRKGCLVCQASESPNYSLTGPIRVNPVIEGFFASLSLDVFSMPTVEWEGKTYDSILLCVDRATNWILARPTQAEGLTGAQAAHLLLEGGWGEVAIPSIVTSDQGTQFVSQFFRTFCSRLGIS